MSSQPKTTSGASVHGVAEQLIRDFLRSSRELSDIFYSVELHQVRRGEPTPRVCDFSSVPPGKVEEEFQRACTELPTQGLALVCVFNVHDFLIVVVRPAKC
jgi:hypothetical protein